MQRFYGVTGQQSAIAASRGVKYSAGKPAVVTNQAEADDVGVKLTKLSRHLSSND